MSLFGFFDNEPKEESENKGIVCPSTGHVYRNWEEYGEATDPYFIGEQYGRKMTIVFPELNDWLDCHAAKHVDRAIETHDNVEYIFDMCKDLQKSVAVLIEQNKQLVERLERLEGQHEVER